MVRQTRRKTGGGWEQGPALSKNAYYVPEYKSYNDCSAQMRPGSIQSNPNPGLAQVQMAGGRRRTKRRGLKRGGGCGLKRGGKCGTKRRTAKQNAGCGCMLRGGSRKRSRSSTCGYYSARGGRYQIDTSQSIGGEGPIVAPTYAHVPCESARPMPLNPTIPTMLADSPNPDVNVSGLRPAFIQGGGSLAYDAPRAGFAFTPNISQGQVLNPGQIPFNEVVPQTVGCSKMQKVNQHQKLPKMVKR